MWLEQGCERTFFQTKNTYLGIHILEGLGMDDVGVFTAILSTWITAKWYIWCIFSPFWYA
jgi:hypothetical protein